MEALIQTEHQQTTQHPPVLATQKAEKVLRIHLRAEILHAVLSLIRAHKELKQKGATEAKLIIPVL